MLEILYPWIHLGGRTLFSLVFILSGMMHLVKLNDMAGHAASRGIPAAKAATLVTGIMILVAGISLVLGWHRFVAAGLIAIFTFFTAVLMHPFWKEEDPMAQMNEMTHFLKDLALCGAALVIAYFAGHPWPMSLGG